MTQQEPQRPRRAPGRTPPASQTAEESVVGCMLLSEDGRETARRLGLERDDFWWPHLGVIAETSIRLYESGKPGDVPAVAEELRETNNEKYSRAALQQLAGNAPASANTGHYVKIVQEFALLRSLIRVAGDISELGYEEPDAHRAIETASELLSRVSLPLGGEADPSVAEFVASFEAIEYVIPGLLGVEERLLIVAAEKYGKSTMIRQIAVCCSQGIDPFHHHPINPINVILFDLENPKQITQQKLGSMLDICGNSFDHLSEPDRMRVHSRRAGMNLLERAGERWLNERLAANTAVFARAGWGADPLLVCIGPIYKMLDDELDQVQVKRLQSVLERAASRFGCALVMETHAPHESFRPGGEPRKLRPAGPRSWLRWAEFCRGLEPDRPGFAAFYDCQGARDERPWPPTLERGDGKGWPWRAERPM